jgi:hypothetical protein
LIQFILNFWHFCYRRFVSWLTGARCTPAGAFDVLAVDSDDLRDLPLSMRKANLARLLARRPDAPS